MILTVGHNMQNTSSKDFPTLNGNDAGSHSTNTEICPTLIYKIPSTSRLSPTMSNFPKLSNNGNNEIPPTVPIKLEDINTIEFFPSNSSIWQHYQINDLADSRSFLDYSNSLDHNGTKLLLQGSDDPLISHGANSVLSNDDDHPADFARGLITETNNLFQNAENKQDCPRESSELSNQQKSSQRPVKSGCSNLTRQQLKVKANLMSARNQQHQQSQVVATPLNSASNQKNPKTKYKKGTAVKLRFHHQALPPEYLSHYEATQGQQKMCKSQSNLKLSNQRNTSKTTNSFQKPSQPRNSHENVRSWLQKIAEIQRTANASKACVASGTMKSNEKHQCQPNTGTKKTCELQETLNLASADANNNYKAQKRPESLNMNNSSHSTNTNCPNSNRLHYSDLPFMGEITLDNCKPRRGRKPKKADICHLIYKNYGTILPKKTKPENRPNYISSIINIKSQCLRKAAHEQPLNLCLRDHLNDSYSISSGDELSETNSSCPTPVSTPFDYARDTMLANNLNKSLKNITEQNDIERALSANGDKLIHPATICYKKLLESETFPHSANDPYKTLKKDSQFALKIPLPSDFCLSEKVQKCLSNPTDLNVDNTEPVTTSFSAQSENCFANTININPVQHLITPQKRKRSAIFIPPMNVENTNNHATEVSICKFKFTGGSKPTLQEKKMISVDAGGNYCYFSGTGDKASRGYEYFPRESLQHTAGLLPGVNCTGQKISIGEPPPSSHGLGNDLLHVSESSTSSAPISDSAAQLEVSKNEACTLPIMENSLFSNSSPATLTTNLCTEPTKKSSIPPHVKKLGQKEKLRKAFREQGFLIQTQQLESAEGATYCKFRQLKKFTRYLFRNWKDYLPNDKSNISKFTSNKNTSLITDEDKYE